MAEGGQTGMRVALGFGHVLLMCHSSRMDWAGQIKSAVNK